MIEHIILGLVVYLLIGVFFLIPECLRAAANEDLDAPNTKWETIQLYAAVLITALQWPALAFTRRDRT
jgi:hypothetical protein